MTRGCKVGGSAVAIAAALGLIACGGSPAPGVERPAAEPAAPQAERSTPDRPDRNDTPDGYVEMHAAGIVVFNGGHTLGLVDADEDVMVPISIGGTEALSISLRLASESFARPLTHDLLDSVLVSLGGEIGHVQIDRMEQGVFFASVHLRRNDEILTELDARSSDAVALALGGGAPIFVAHSVVEQAGLSRDELEGQMIPPAPEPLAPPNDGEGEEDGEGDRQDGDEGERERDGDTIEARAVPPSYGPVSDQLRMVSMVSSTRSMSSGSCCSRWAIIP